MRSLVRFAIAKQTGREALFISGIVVPTAKGPNDSPEN